MRRVGSGREYRVYDEGGGRVLKIRQSVWERLLRSVVCAVRDKSFKVLPKTLIFHIRGENDVPVLASRLEAMPLETKKLLGNFQMVDRYHYTQDLVTPLRDYFPRHSLEENIAAVGRYVSLVKFLWTLGLGDRYYNFTWNVGVYADGTVAQIDIADLTTKVDIVAYSTRNRNWLKTGIPAIRDERLQNECVRLLNSELTYEAFVDRWPPGDGISNGRPARRSTGPHGSALSEG
jgi:hypothetical protein